MLDRFEVEGGVPLQGELTCAGAKNAALPLMAATLLTEGVTVIERVPDLQDIRTMAMVLRYLGADVSLEGGSLTIDTTACKGYEAPYELVRKMRASFYVFGPLVARYGRATVSMPGGCALGARPVDLHIKGMERLGCAIDIEGGYVAARIATPSGRLKGTRIHFDVTSVGATGNIMMAATAAEGVTTIDNAACEPEIVDLSNMLNAMGAQISGAGTPIITVTGPTPLKAVKWRVIPDRIVAGSFILAAAITAGAVTLNGCRADHLAVVVDKLVEAGVAMDVTASSISIDARNRRLKGVDITTAPYPGFPTDLQPLWVALMTLAQGDAVVTDTIYPERFTHILELARLGAKIRKEGNSVTIRGVDHLTGASVMCSDIRAAAGVVLATLAARGHSDVLRVYHLDRGYERFDQRLASLGARIRRIRE